MRFLYRALTLAVLPVAASIASADLAVPSNGNLAANPIPVNSSCRELNQGEKRTSTASGLGHTGLSSNYWVEKVAERTHRIHLNIRFKTGDGYNGPADFEQHYRQFAKDCLTANNPKLASIRDDGVVDRIELTINDTVAPDPANSPVTAITLGPKGYDPRVASTFKLERSAMLDWPSNIDCETIVHELVHITGLVDEYDENERVRTNIYHGEKKPLEYSCRVFGPPTSLMRNQWLALGPTNKYPLQPAHVSALVYPGCEERNAIYYKCARRAYQSRGCGDRPPECLMSNGWLRQNPPKLSQK